MYVCFDLQNQYIDTGLFLPESVVGWNHRTMFSSGILIGIGGLILLCKNMYMVRLITNYMGPVLQNALYCIVVSAVKISNKHKQIAYMIPSSFLISELCWYSFNKFQLLWLFCPPGIKLYHDYCICIDDNQYFRKKKRFCHYIYQSHYCLVLSISFSTLKVF